MSFCACSWDSGICASLAAISLTRASRFSKRHRLVDEFDCGGFLSGQRLAGQGVPFHLRQAQAVQPHAGEVGAPHARVRRADDGVVAGDDDVGAQGVVTGAADAPAVDLGDHGFGGPPDGHELLIRAGLARPSSSRSPCPDPSDRRCSSRRPSGEPAAEVVAAGERAACAAQHDHLDRRGRVRRVRSPSRSRRASAERWC